MINACSLRSTNLCETWFMLALLLGALVLSSASFASATPATVSIDIGKFAFEPKDVTVAPGTTIIWTNHDETPHTVTSQLKAFTSKALDTDDRFEYTFDRAGDFYYYCTVHPFMNGVVHVREP